MSIIIAILIFGVIVLVHELGHFIAARKCGILVEEFAIGMGPKLLGIQKKDTLYTIRLLPIGGFCKLLGEDENIHDSRALNNKTVKQRITVMSSGVLMNFLLAFIIFAGLTMINGYVETVVTRVLPGSPAEAAGLQKGDKVQKINGTRINIFEDLSFELNESGGKPVTLTLKRGGEIIVKTITPAKNQDNRYIIGFECLPKAGIFEKAVEGVQKSSIVACIVNGFWQILFWIKLTLTGIIRLVTFNLSVEDMSGPIGIVTEINKVYTVTIAQSIFYTIQTMGKFVAILSANLGVFNLLPLPALDGGRLAFLVVEGIRKKPVAPEREGLIHFIGFVLLMALAVFIAYNDIAKLI